MKRTRRVVTVLLVAGALGGAATVSASALSPSAGSPAVPASQPTLQATAVTGAQADMARMELARVSALRAAQQRAAARHAAFVAARHRAFLASRARLAAAEARQQPLTTATPAVAAPAHPAETFAQRGQRIYASFHYDLGKLGYRIVFKPYARGLLGLTDSGSRTVTVYVRSTESDLVLAHSIAHEMGHALDFSRGSDGKHQLYLSIRQLHSPLADWFGCNNCTDYSTAAGDWAEVFAQWLAGPGDFRSQMAGVPSRSELSQLTPLFSL